MTDFTIQGFTYDRFTGADGVKLNVAHAGEGSPVILLHGFPQTHLMWNAVARDLRQDHAVIALDLRGYGDSDKPEAVSPETYSKRTMASDVVEIAAQFGYDRFAVIGHDRGALVALRAGLKQSPTLASSTYFLRWIRGRCFAVSTPKSPGTSTSWRNQGDCPRK